MSTSKELRSFMKRNKVARLAYAKKKGYSSWEAYRDFLKGVSAIDEKVSSEELTDMVIAFDTTGSMRSFIDDVKKHVKELVPKLFKQNPNLKISIVAFGDYCDMKNIRQMEFGNAYQVLGLTNDENKIIDFITNAKRTGGGDSDEFYELVIRKTAFETSWRKGASKTVLLIGDCNPHKRGYIINGVKMDIDWKEEAIAANASGIVFDTLRIRKYNNFYSELSKMTNGVCLNFSNSQKTADLLEATSLARGGSNTTKAFVEKSNSSEVVNDSELTAVYSTYHKSLIVK